jgi:leucyl-tRNA synthetase
VLMGYGDGAVMGVPAHDERDFAFAKKYGIGIKPVVAPRNRFRATAGFGAAPAISVDRPSLIDRTWYSSEAWDEIYATKDGYCYDSDDLNGLGYCDAVNKVAELLAAQGLGEKKTTWRLRDWSISRQRYWGTPIPIVHCASCGDVPVPENELPVLLPEDLLPDGSGNPLNKCASFINVPCPRCAEPARRETDTMDTFVDSAWYYMRYACPDATDSMVDARNDYWMPMDQYIGGIEHAVLHLLYARFWTKAMRDMGLLRFDEPFTRLFTQGMLLNECFYREDEAGKKRWFYPNEVAVRHDERGTPVSATAREDGLPVWLGGIEKMSKSKNNVVEPREFISRFGADTARLFTIFAGPPDQSAAWSDSGAEGAFRYLRRLWAFGVKHEAVLRAAAAAPAAPPASAAGPARRLRFELHTLLGQISHDFERMQYNTVASGAMKLLNALEGFDDDGSDSAKAALHEGLGILLRTLYPTCPHITQAMWQSLGYADALGDLLDAPWPGVDESALQRDEVELALQINGKLRGTIRVPSAADSRQIEATAVASPEFARFGEGRAPKKVVVVPGRLVNVVA